jgi:hypothetical protein
VIFGGHGRKSKVRGDVFFPCNDCAELNAFGLVENYGYGQLYGVRLAKFKTERAMMCSKCNRGYGLDKTQWDQAILASKRLDPQLKNLTIKDMAQSAVALGHTLFGAEMGETVRELLWEQLGEEPPFELSEDGDDEPLALSDGSESDETKSCPECAETVKAAARKCRFCGYIFEEVDQAGSEGQQPARLD